MEYWLSLLKVITIVVSTKNEELLLIWPFLMISCRYSSYLELLSIAEETQTSNILAANIGIWEMLPSSEESVDSPQSSSQLLSLSACSYYPFSAIPYPIYPMFDMN